MEKINRFLLILMIVVFLLTGCFNEPVNNETGKKQEEISIILSEDGIFVDNKSISEENKSAVYIGADIIYYEEGKGKTYGKGKKKDSHSKEEADKHTVITIAQPGTYRVSGKITYGQIAVDLGKESRENEKAVVNLILDNAEINCSVAPAIVVYNAYECGSRKEKDANPVVDTTGAGFNLVLAQNSENIINGSYVAEIYEEGTTKEDLKNEKAKKKYKFDASIDSLVSFNIASKENGRLTVNAQKEGISSSLHMTINSGEIIINAADDSINTNKNDVSVFTMNGGTLVCNSGLGKEGDGIDSNGFLVINGGFVTAFANSESIDSGLDSDKGIYLNGGTVFGSGNMYDKISKDSGQLFMVLEFDKKVKENDLIMITDQDDNPVTAFRAVNDYHIAVYSSPRLAEGRYNIYKVSDVTGDLERNIYSNISGYKNPVLLNSYQLEKNGDVS